MDCEQEYEPSMSTIPDVTSLINSPVNRSIKRKRSISNAATADLKPILKGGISVSHNKVIWNGWWGLSKRHYIHSFTDDVIKAPFYFERTDLAVPSSSIEITHDGYFNGYFCMQDLSKKCSSPIYVKHFEKRILLRFVKKPDGSFNVVGSGENKFGKFLIDGLYDPTQNCISCSRNYLPNTRPMRRRISERPGSPIISPKRSSRPRVPTKKFKESYALGEKESKVRTFNFEGSGELSTYLKSLKVEKLSEVIRLLETRRMRCFKLAKSQVSNILKQSQHPQEEKINAAVNEMYIKHKIEKSKAESDESDPEGGDAEDTEYVSIFHIGENTEITDPLLFDPAATIPDVLKSPIGIDLKDVFVKDNVRNARSDCDDNSVIIREELKDLCPINDVDFSDLAYLDAETIKELNDFVEFSCPSKGA